MSDFVLQHPFAVHVGFRHRSCQDFSIFFAVKACKGQSFFLSTKGIGEVLAHA